MRVTLRDDEKQKIKPIFEKVCANYGFVPRKADMNLRENIEAFARPGGVLLGAYELVPKIGTPEFTQTMERAVEKSVDNEVKTSFNRFLLQVVKNDKYSGVGISVSPKPETLDWRCQEVMAVYEIIDVSIAAAIAFAGAHLSLWDSDHDSIFEWTEKLERVEKIFGKIPSRRMKRICHYVGFPRYGRAKTPTNIDEIRRERERYELKFVMGDLLEAINKKLGAHLLYCEGSYRRTNRDLSLMLERFSGGAYSGTLNSNSTAADYLEAQDVAKMLTTIWKSQTVTHQKIIEDKIDEQGNPIIVVSKIKNLNDTDITNRIEQIAHEAGVDCILRSTKDGIPLSDLVA